MTSFGRRVLVRGGAFIGACLITGVLLALQVGLPRGAIPAAVYLAAHFAPFALIDALLVPTPRSGLGRLGRIAFSFLILCLLSVAWQWQAFRSVPSDLQVQIAVESLMRNFAFLGAYLLLDVSLSSLWTRRVPA